MFTPQIDLMGAARILNRYAMMHVDNALLYNVLILVSN